MNKEQSWIHSLNALLIIAPMWDLNAQIVFFLLQIICIYTVSYRLFLGTHVIAKET